MSEPVSSRELKRIYLQPRCNVDPHDGRVWCEDNVWPDDDCDEPGVEYVRADLLDAAIAATREECAAIADKLAVIRAGVIQRADLGEDEWDDGIDVAHRIALAIRAGGEG